MQPHWKRPESNWNRPASLQIEIARHLMKQIWAKKLLPSDANLQLLFRFVFWERCVVIKKFASTSASTSASASVLPTPPSPVPHPDDPNPESVTIERFFLFRLLSAIRQLQQQTWFLIFVVSTQRWDGWKSCSCQWCSAVNRIGSFHWNSHSSKLLVTFPENIDLSAEHIHRKFGASPCNKLACDQKFGSSPYNKMARVSFQRMCLLGKVTNISMNIRRNHFRW